MTAQNRTAHYVASTHWDREWYESLQGYRMRLVSLLDEVLATLSSDPAFKTFVMDGQVIPIHDFLEIRPEQREVVRKFVREGRLKLGPWYVLPDEWIVSGESIVRNLQMGMRLADEFGAPTSRAGFVCDQFGHISQLPQIFASLGFPAAFIWRGTNDEGLAQLTWKSPDGTVIPAHRFGRQGYCSYAFKVRDVMDMDKPLELDDAVGKLVEYTLFEAKRSPAAPVLLFDGGDHLEIEPQTSKLIARANETLASHGIKIVHSNLDAYMADLVSSKSKLTRQLVGELRETGKAPIAQDEVWYIPGTLSSRIHLKQRNAACEDELCQWAEPFSAFASADLGKEYPLGYLRESWRWLIENHPHDSMCGCSIDQVHQDMIYRFDQSLGIASRLTKQAHKAIALASAPKQRADGALVISVFNSTSEPIDEPVDLEIPLPTSWPKKFQEFFGFEEKFAFKLTGPDGKEIPYQLVSQRRDRWSFRRQRRKFPQPDMRHIVGVTANLNVPAFGYTTLVVEPVEGPTRYTGASMAISHRGIENEHLRVEANANGTINLTDKRTGKTFEQLLTFEQRADIGDGWYHGLAVNDQIFSSAASNAEVAIVADGIGKATLRIVVTMNVPEQFDFKSMTRSEKLMPLRIISDVTLRKGADRVEVTTAVDNTVLDHRLRVLFPTNLKGKTYQSDTAYDVVERDIKLPDDNDTRREIEIETRPQITWTAFGDNSTGLAVVSRGIPECTVRDTPDRPIALTLIRAFRRAIFAGDNHGGQIQGRHEFRYAIVPFAKQTPTKKLFVLGQRVNAPVRQVDLIPQEFIDPSVPGTLPRTQSFLKTDGEAVVTSVQREDGKLLVRLFNPHKSAQKVTLETPTKPSAAKTITLDGRDDESSSARANAQAVQVSIPAHRIATVVIG